MTILMLGGNRQLFEEIRYQNEQKNKDERNEQKNKDERNERKRMHEENVWKGKCAACALNTAG